MASRSPDKPRAAPRSPAAPPGESSRARLISVVERLVDAANRHDAAGFAAFYADDAVAVSPVFGEVRGLPAIVASFEAVFRTLPDSSFHPEHVLVDGDRLAIVGTMTATDRSGWFGLPPTNSLIRYRLLILCTMVDGKIVRDERIYDSTTVLDLLEKARLEAELKMAAEVQGALLSQATQESAYCESAGGSIPCRAIGGDFFEFINLPRNRSGIVLGDVSGKGVPAALLASLVQGMFVSEEGVGEGPAATLFRINQHLLARGLDSRFVTLAYAILTPSGKLTYAIAGHNPPVLLTSAGPRRLEAGGPMLGLFPEATFPEASLQMAPGDTLVMFTDGVTEARNAQEEEFGDDRLLASLLDSDRLTPGVLLRQVFEAVRNFSKGSDQADDMTLAVTRFRPARDGSDRAPIEWQSSNRE